MPDNGFIGFFQQRYSIIRPGSFILSTLWVFHGELTLIPVSLTMFLAYWNSIFILYFALISSLDKVGFINKQN